MQLVKSSCFLTGYVYVSILKTLTLQGSKYMDTCTVLCGQLLSIYTFSCPSKVSATSYIANTCNVMEYVKCMSKFGYPKSCVWQNTYIGCIMCFLEYFPRVLYTVKIWVLNKNRVYSFSICTSISAGTIQGWELFKEIRYACHILPPSDLCISYQ